MENNRSEIGNLIGLTGGIGAGKSVVARVLRLKGYEVYDCDLRARAIMEESAEIRDELINKFGESCYRSDASLDRTFLAQRIFSFREERIWLNTLVHEAVRIDIVEWSRDVDAELRFVESAILHTSGLDRICRRIWLVTAPEDVRFVRALERGGIDPENLRARMKSQEMEFDELPLSKVDRIDNFGMKPVVNRINRLLSVI